MDIDTLHRNVTRLMKFMERVDKQKVVSDKETAPFDTAKVKELEERLQSFGERLDSADLANLSDRLGALENYKTNVIEPTMNDLGDMVSWFHQNKTMLEGAIAMADAFDGPDAPTVAEQPVADAGTAAGASSGEVATDPAVGVDASEAAADEAKPAV